MPYGTPSNPYNGLYKSPISSASPSASASPNLSGQRPTSMYSPNQNWKLPPTINGSPSGGFGQGLGRTSSISNSTSAYTNNRPTSIYSSSSTMTTTTSNVPPGAGTYYQGNAINSTQSAGNGFQKPSYLARPSSFTSLSSASKPSITNTSTFPSSQSYQNPYQTPSQFSQKPTLSPARPPSPGFGGGYGGGVGVGGKTLVGPYRSSSIARQW